MNPGPDDYKEERIRELLSSTHGRWAMPQGYWLNVAELLLEKLDELRAKTTPVPSETNEVGEREKEKASFKGSLGDAITDDDVTFITLDDSTQLLEFRFGPVFSGDEIIGHGLWISYQRRAYQTDEAGPFLMSPETFERLVEHVQRRKKLWSSASSVKKAVSSDTTKK
jgi:hypothetical protein